MEQGHPGVQKDGIFNKIVFKVLVIPKKLQELRYGTMFENLGGGTALCKVR